MLGLLIPGLLMGGGPARRPAAPSFPIVAIPADLVRTVAVPADLTRTVAIPAALTRAVAIPADF